VAVGDAPRRVAVVDIGSNSARVVAYGLDAAGQLRIFASSRAALRLVRDVDRGHRLSPETTDGVVGTLRDFRALALGAGAEKIVGVATAALRDAENGPALMARLRDELGFAVDVIDGDAEARYGFLGGVRGLPVEHGLLFDLGGGSLQVTRFFQRALDRDWSFPLGALRLSQAFLASDPPAEEELRRLRKHVRRTLEEAGVPALRPGEELVGTGGTVRNLAKIDARARDYPIARVHGYVLAREAAREIAGTLASRRQEKRERTAGLSGERGDSIVGGAVAIDTLMATVGAGHVRVSGQGVREGLAYSLLGSALPSPADVRERSVASLTARFAGWDGEHAQRRVAVVEALWSVLMPAGESEMREAVRHGAHVLDIGRAVDFFDRHEHAADFVIASDLDGFTHRDIALVAIVVRSAGDEDADPALYRPLLGREDRTRIAQAGVLLALADDLEERCPPGTAVGLTARLVEGGVVVEVPALLGWRPRALGKRFARAFGRELVVKAGGVQT
jgi:exopolyphosphatase / guanosine-5'-triphosphate,3'-diphosphate pyrophosphatase